MSINQDSSLRRSGAVDSTDTQALIRRIAYEHAMSLEEAKILFQRQLK